MKRVSFKGKKLIVAMFVLVIPTALITGCGKASISGMVTSAVQDKIVDIVDEAIPAANAILARELYDNEFTEFVNETKSKYDFEDVYTTDEFLSLLKEEVENCYEKDLEVNKDATPTKQVYSKTDDMVDCGTMTFILVKGLCEEVNPISSIASNNYYMFDEYYLEVIKESTGFLQCNCYAKIRSSLLEE
jgi:hypothetical protein